MPTCLGFLSCAVVRTQIEAVRVFHIICDLEPIPHVIVVGKYIVRHFGYRNPISRPEKEYPCNMSITQGHCSKVELSFALAPKGSQQKKRTGRPGRCLKYSDQRVGFRQ